MSEKDGHVIFCPNCDRSFTLIFDIHNRPECPHCHCTFPATLGSLLKEWFVLRVEFDEKVETALGHWRYRVKTIEEMKESLGEILKKLESEKPIKEARDE